jgi:hypothetical protein
MPTTPYVDPDTVFDPATGLFLPASWLSTVRDNQEFFARPPGCKVLRTSIQSVVTGTWDSVAFTAADAYDTDGFHNPSSSAEQITVPAGLGGWYQVNATIRWNTGNVGDRAIRAIVNSSTVYDGDVVDAAQFASAVTIVNFADEILLNVGDVLEIQGYHQQGANLSIARARCSMRLSGLA